MRRDHRRLPRLGGGGGAFEPSPNRVFLLWRAGVPRPPLPRPWYHPRLGVGVRIRIRMLGVAVNVAVVLVLGVAGCAL